MPKRARATATLKTDRAAVGILRGTKAAERLDLAMVRRGLAESRERAQGLVLAGAVTVAGQVARRASQVIPSGTPIEVSAAEHPFVGRGGLKLAAALDAFGIDPAGMVALDIGASTGGFTDCLLQRGAARVYAVDVGYGQLAWRLRQDPRVVVIERCNARYLNRSQIPEPVDLATIDVSFISLTMILPAVRSCLKTEGQVVALLKPQFEVGKGKVGKGGIVRDEHLRREAVERVRHAVETQRWLWDGEIPSPIAGQKGNLEYLIRLRQA
jgi:23S rRNA (cytidine1920-2'-O)/16S rRNA (cytidine1409-2'-O)-methyltransferase